MRSRTRLIQAGVVLSGTYAYKTIDLSNIGALNANMENVVSFHFKNTSAGGGDTITIKPQVLYSHQTAGSEDIGWQDMVEGTGTLSLVESTVAASTASAFSVTYSVDCTNMRVGVKGTGTYSIWATTSEVR